MVTSFFSSVFKTELFTVTGYWRNFCLLCIIILYYIIGHHWPSLAIFSFVSLHALIWRFSVNSRFSLFRSAFGCVVTLLSYLAVYEVTFYRNVPWPVCVGPICRSILSGIPVLSLTGFSACRVVICENGFPPGSKLAFFRGPAVLRSNWPFFGIRVTLEHCTAVLPCYLFRQILPSIC
jgi:hypothetical protein